MVQIHPTDALPEQHPNHRLDSSRPRGDDQGMDDYTNDFKQFADIVEAETTPQGRRMINAWAHPGAEDSNILDATFKLMWKD